ncbi:MAG: hypothetical protein BroJett025_01310 [Patescibacteria group bacterium]|nr:MAG: hypothetical protein BroJett025_01310 [Patescibacteria group bacterium]
MTGPSIKTTPMQATKRAEAEVKIVKLPVVFSFVFFVVFQSKKSKPKLSSKSGWNNLSREKAK